MVRQPVTLFALSLISIPKLVLRAGCLKALTYSRTPKLMMSPEQPLSGEGNGFHGKGSRGLCNLGASMERGPRLGTDSLEGRLPADGCQPGALGELLNPRGPTQTPPLQDGVTST